MDLFLLGAAAWRPSVSKALVVWTVAIGVVLSVLGLWVITGEPGRQTADPSLFTESMEPELPPPADNGLVPGAGATLTR